MTEPNPPATNGLRARSREQAAAIAALLVTLGTILATLGPQVQLGVGYDDAIYVDLGRSLADGEGYRHGYLPGNPPAVHYPPLFPFWLALWTTVGRWSADHAAWLSLGNVALASASAALWAWWGVRALRLPPWVAAAAASASTLVFPARMLIALAFSEPLSWTLLGAAALVSTSTGRRSPRLLLIGLLPLVRTILLPFAFTAALGEASDRRSSALRRASGILLALLPTSLWMLWSGMRAGELPPAWAGSYGTYTQMYASSSFQATDVLLIIWLQARTLSAMLADMFTIPGALVVLACLTIGAIRLTRTHPWLGWGMIGYLALILIWPFTPERFVWGLLPLLALIASDGAATILRRVWTAPIARVATIVALLLPVVWYGRATIKAYTATAWLAPLRAVSERNAPLVRWGRALSTRAPVATETDGLFALATGLPSFPIVSPDPADKVGRGTPIAGRVEQSLCTVGDGYIALTTLDSDVAEAVRTLVRDSASRVSFSPPEQIGNGAVVARFSCSR